MSSDYKSDKPIFFLIHPTAKIDLNWRNTLCKTIPLAGDLSLTYVDQPAMEQAGLMDNDCVGIHVTCIDNVPFLSDMLEMPVHLLKLFYLWPTAIHFAGLMFGWSLSDGENIYGRSWRKVEEDCWYGDSTSMILNQIMPKGGAAACGCGCPGLAVQAVRKIMNCCTRNPLVPDAVAQQNRADTFYKVDSNNEKDEYIGGLSYFVAYVLDSTDMTEHGSGIGHAWLTEKGFWFSILIEAALESEDE